MLKLSSSFSTIIFLQTTYHPNHVQAPLKLTCSHENNFSEIIYTNPIVRIERFSPRRTHMSVVRLIDRSIDDKSCLSHMHILWIVSVLGSQAIRFCLLMNTYMTLHALDGLRPLTYAVTHAHIGIDFRIFRLKPSGDWIRIDVYMFMHFSQRSFDSVLSDRTCSFPQQLFNLLWMLETCYQHTHFHHNRTISNVRVMATVLSIKCNRPFANRNSINVWFHYPSIGMHRRIVFMHNVACKRTHARVS